jgi:hypothetical protein
MYNTTDNRSLVALFHRKDTGTMHITGWMQSVTRSRSRGVGHEVSVTRSRSRGVGHAMSEAMRIPSSPFALEHIALLAVFKSPLRYLKDCSI